MLAKLWKKILLFICIIAILFDITAKLVRRTTLKDQLESVVGGSSLSKYFKKEDETTLNNKNKEQNEIVINTTTVKNKTTTNNENGIPINRVTVHID